MSLYFRKTKCILPLYVPLVSHKLQFVFLGSAFLHTFKYFHVDLNTLDSIQVICPNHHKRNCSPDGQHPNVLCSNHGANRVLTGTAQLSWLHYLTMKVVTCEED